MNSSSTVTSERSYLLSIRLTVSYSKTVVPNGFSIGLTVSSTNVTEGVFGDTDSVSIGTVNTNTAVNDFINDNGGKPTISYGGSTYNVTDPYASGGSPYGSNNTVRLSNSTNGDGGIGKPGSGRIYFDFNVPDGKRFFIALSYTAVDANNTPQRVNLTVDIDSDPVELQLSLVGTGTTYICKGGYDGVTSKTTMPGNYDWLSGWDVKVTIEAAEGSLLKTDTTLDIVFKSS